MNSASKNRRINKRVDKNRHKERSQEIKVRLPVAQKPTMVHTPLKGKGSYKRNYLKNIKMVFSIHEIPHWIEEL